MPEMSWVDGNDGACTSGFVRGGKYICAIRLYILGEMLADSHTYELHLV